MPRSPGEAAAAHRAALRRLRTSALRSWFHGAIALYFRLTLAHGFPAMRWLKPMLAPILWCCFLAGGLALRAGAATPLFTEVYDLLRTNLLNCNAADLDRTAMEGLIKRLAPQAELLPKDGAPPQAGPVLQSTNVVLDNAFGYLRPARVDAGAIKETSLSTHAMQATNKLKGWILDLRFTEGADYKAAVDLAARFVEPDQAVLNPGEGMLHPASGEKPSKSPLIVLVNHRTAAAAEALAGILHQAGAALLLGTNTAGQAFVSKDFPLQNGQKLRVATAAVKLSDGSALPSQGLKPDILVSVRPEDEQAYMEDPYHLLARGLPPGAKGASETNPASLATNKSSRHRINEADLVRLWREGQDYGDDGLTGSIADPARPVLRDPVLARALDLLKGLALVRRNP